VNHYVIVALGPNSRAEQEITDSKHTEILEARTVILEAVYIEEKFEILLENYLQFELQLLDTSLRQLVFSAPIVESVHASRLEITRCMINLLTTCKLYLDQSAHNLSRAFGSGSVIQKAHEENKSSKYDASRSYRIMEELRNHTQHRGYPVHAIVVSSGLIEPQVGAESAVAIIPKLSPSQLEEEGGFKKSVLAELKQLPDDELDLRIHVRAYVDALHDVHENLRQSLRPALDHARTVLNGARETLTDTQDEAGEIWGIEIKSGDTNADRAESIHFPFRMFEALDGMRSKNRIQRSLLLRFVSSQINPYA
jgi:hypothetical protein